MDEIEGNLGNPNDTLINLKNQQTFAQCSTFLEESEQESINQEICMEEMLLLAFKPNEPGKSRNKKRKLDRQFLRENSDVMHDDSEANFGVNCVFFCKKLIIVFIFD